MHRHLMDPTGWWLPIPAWPRVEPGGWTKGDAPHVHPKYYEKIGHECFTLELGMLL